MESKNTETIFYDTSLISRIFERILSFKNQCDVNLKSDEVTVPAHRLILAGASPVFEKMFFGGMSESRSKDVTIKGVDSQVLAPIVNYIYTGKIPLEPETVQSVFEGASFLRLTNLKNVCENKMTTYVDKKNALGYFKYANIMSCEKLSDVANKIIAEEFEDISQGEEFLTIQGEDLLTLIKRDDLKVKEETLYEACLRWIKDDVKKKMVFFDEIFECIRFPLMAPDYLNDIVEKEELVKSSPKCQQILKETYRLILLSRDGHDMKNDQRLKPRRSAVESKKAFANKRRIRSRAYRVSSFDHYPSEVPKEDDSIQWTS